MDKDFLCSTIAQTERWPCMFVQNMRTLTGGTRMASIRQIRECASGHKWETKCVRDDLGLGTVPRITGSKVCPTCGGVAIRIITK